MNEVYANDPAITVINCGDANHEINSVTVWLPAHAIEVYFTAKGCYDLRRFYNGATPTDRPDDSDLIHVCDWGKFITALNEAHDIAKPLWRPLKNE